jgi:epoxyqueuosine reductase QueG
MAKVRGYSFPVQNSPALFLPAIAVMINAEPGSFPTIDPIQCTDCRKCISACPRGAIFEPLNVCCAKCVKYCMTIEVDCHREKPAVAVDRCDACGLCIDACAFGAIAWTPAPDQHRSAIRGSRI